MRRDGVAFGHRTNHTLRMTPCTVRFTRTGKGVCEYHSADLMEYAYQSLLEAEGKKRYSRREIYDEAVKITKARGCTRSRLGACTMGSCARNSLRTRNWSGCYDTSETRQEKREFIKREIQEELIIAAN